MSKVYKCHDANCSVSRTERPEDTLPDIYLLRCCDQGETHYCPKCMFSVYLIDANNRYVEEGYKLLRQRSKEHGCFTDTGCRSTQIVEETISKVSI